MPASNSRKGLNNVQQLPRAKHGTAGAVRSGPSAVALRAAFAVFYAAHAQVGNLLDIGLVGRLVVTVYTSTRSIDAGGYGLRPRPATG